MKDGAPVLRQNRLVGFVDHAAQFGADTHLDVAAQLDVGAAARHVGGDRHRAGPAGLGDDRGFLLVIAGIQDGVRNLLLLQKVSQMF